MTAQIPRTPNVRGSAAALLLLVAGCAAAPAVPPRLAAPAPVAAPQLRRAETLVGRTARELQSAFGTPSSILAEGAARRLQFAGSACVLDAYLYPVPGGEPAVTHVDTRTPTGETIAHDACVAALRKS